MTEESETKMEALKKAYAEIILNTSKEAAARVMVADRKAHYFEQQLVFLKEESLSMLLRLKDHFNSTNIEAEARSLKQQMKIEELDAQLCEAEGIIVDLRGELKQAQKQLEILKHNQKNSLDEHLVTGEPVQGCLPQNNIPNCSVISHVSDAKSLIDYENEVVPLHPTALDNMSCHAMDSSNLSVKSHLSQFDAPNDHFSSIIMQNRETDLCRNGCTQRIRAFEGNMSNVRLPTSQSEDERFLWNIQSITNAEETVNCRQYVNDSVNSCKEGLCYSKTDHSNAKNFPSKCLAQHSSCYKDQAVRPLRRSARKNARYREAITSLHGSCKKFRTGPLKGCTSTLSKQAVEIPIRIAEMDPKKIKVCCVSESSALSFKSKATVCAVEGNAAETREASSSKSHTVPDDALLDSVLVDVPILEEFGSSHCQLARDSKFLKFTFHRKRRKNVLGKIDNNIHDRDPLKRILESPTNVAVVKNGT